MKAHDVKSSKVLFQLSRGFSLIEMLTTVAIIGILSAIAMNVYGGVVEKSRRTIAENLTETLNTALSRYSHSLWDLRFTKNDTSSADELLILRSLQFDDPNEDVPGQPFMRPDWNPLSSGSTEDYRLLWTGRMFKLAQPGDAGSGLKILFDGTDLGTLYEFPPGFKMVGSR